MGVNREHRQEVSKLIHNQKRTTIWTLEEIIDKLAKFDDEELSDLKVMLETADGSKLIPISHVSYDKDEDVIVIG